MTMNFSKKSRYSQDVRTLSHQEVATISGAIFESAHLFTGIADAGTGEILITTPVDPHVIDMIFNIGADGNTLVELFEGTTVSGNGTEITLKSLTNRKEAANHVTAVNIYHTPTITTDGDLIFQDYVFGGSGNFATGGSGNLLRDWILKPDTNYLLRLTNQSGAAANLHAVLRWEEYETG